MPKAGFQSITMSEEVYNRYHAQYDSNKEALTDRGISSFAAYVSHSLMAEVDRQQHASSVPLKIVDVVEFGPTAMSVVIADMSEIRIVEVSVRPGLVGCRHCCEPNCMHVGLAYSDHRIYHILESDE